MTLQIRIAMVGAILLAAPLAGQVAKDGDKKSMKKDEDKKDDAKAEKKAEPKVEKKAPPKHYTAAGTLSGKVTEADTSAMTIEIEVRLPGRYGRNEKMEYTLVDDVKVRMLSLPERLDEKNKVIPYTAAEKAKAKGDNPKLPGYTAELSALKRGIKVELTLGTLKPAPGTPKKKAGEPEKPLVTMVVIAADEPRVGEKKKN